MRRETSGLVFKSKVAAFVALLRVHLGVLVSSAPSEHTLRVAQFRNITNSSAVKEVWTVSYVREFCFPHFKVDSAVEVLEGFTP